MSSHLIGNDSGQSSLTQTRRTVKKDVIQCIVPLFGSFYIYFECILGFFLTNVFIKSLRTEASLQRQILLCHIILFSIYIIAPLYIAVTPAIIAASGLLSGLPPHHPDPHL